MMLTIITHLAAVIILFAIGITLTVVPIFFYKTVLKNNAAKKASLGKHMAKLIVPGIILCTPMIYYGYLEIRYHISSFTAEDKLFLAAERNDYKIAAKLIDDGADPSAMCRYGISPIYRAVMADDYEAVRLYLESGADPNFTGDYDITLLGTACSQQENDIAQLLITFGADPDHCPAVFIPALHYAAMYDEGFNADLVEMLIKAGADPSSRVRRYGKEMLPFRYYFDRFEEKVFNETVTDEERAGFARIGQMLYEPYADRLGERVEDIRERLESKENNAEEVS